LKLWVATLAWVGGVLVSGLAPAQSVVPQGSPETAAMDVGRWLTRMHDSARQRAYMGTFVVTAGGYMSSSRIWHVSDGQQQVERVEALTGDACSTYRRNDEVVTFLHTSHTVVRETRESLGIFPQLQHRNEASVSNFYRLKSAGQARVAGLQADVVQLLATDRWRFGYRVWTERKSGLVLKLQTLDATRQVLEQAAFSEVQLDAPVVMARLRAQMDNTLGYRVRAPRQVKTTAEQEGWKLTGAVPGFVLVNCYKRLDDVAPSQTIAPLQCIFSDGLASVSLFAEPFDHARHGSLPEHDQLDMGATHMRVRQFGPWWLTAVGEVPLPTLSAFVQAIERTL